MQRLTKGIYATDLPTLLRENETIQSLIDKAESFKSVVHSDLIIALDAKIANLKLCEVCDYELYESQALQSMNPWQLNAEHS